MKNFIWLIPKKETITLTSADFNEPGRFWHCEKLKDKRFKLQKINGETIHTLSDFKIDKSQYCIFWKSAENAPVAIMVTGVILNPFYNFFYNPYIYLRYYFPIDRLAAFIGVIATIVSLITSDKCCKQPDSGIAMDEVIEYAYFRDVNSNINSIGTNKIDRNILDKWIVKIDTTSCGFNPRLFCLRIEFKYTEDQMLELSKHRLVIVINEKYVNRQTGPLVNHGWRAVPNVENAFELKGLKLDTINNIKRYDCPFEMSIEPNFN